MIIETHAHLNDDRYTDIQEVLQRCQEADVKKIIDIGCDRKRLTTTINLSNKYPEIYSAIGFHPVDAKDYDQEIYQKIKSLASNDKVVAIGEIGLDYHWHPEEKEIQKKVFKEQIELAKELKLPIIIHSREANDDVYQILKEYAPIDGVMHSFAGDWTDAKRFIELGMYIGISGPVTFKNGLTQQEVVANVELEKLVIETDSPYLTPVPYRGKRNEPSYLQYIVTKIAQIRKIEEKQVKEITTANALKLFPRLKDKENDDN